MNDPKRLAEIVRKLHSVEATHVRSEPVHEQFNGETIWRGTEEMFIVTGHPQATCAYAWTYEEHDGKLHNVEVLGLPPVNSAVDAVRAVAVREAQTARNAVKAAVMAQIKREQRDER